jgi:hypothetical protein
MAVDIRSSLIDMTGIQVCYMVLKMRQTESE